MKILNVVVAFFFAFSSISANASTYYFHNDQLSTPKVVTDSAQEIVWQAAASPFGETELAIAKIEQNLRFPGQYFDSETQLHYNYFRDYDPSVGRYLQSDPIGLRGGLNTYAYVGANPYTYSDPTGEFALVGAIIASALYSGLIDFGLQALMHGGNLACISYEQVALTTVLGGLTGGGLGYILKLNQLKHVAKLAPVPLITKFFKGDEAVEHFYRHGNELMQAMGRNAYNLKGYLVDANHVIRTGTWVPEMHGYVKLLGGKGSAKYGFVGLDRLSGKITTFHPKTVSELIRKAPSLGLSK